MVTLHSVKDVVAALGGPTETARIAKSGANNVWNWKSTNKFPADSYLLLSEELKARDLYAPPSLWGMREAAE